MVRTGQEYLGRLGYRVTVFTSSIRAWEEFRARPEIFYLIITDLTLPDMSGAGSAEAVLTRRQDLPVIITTGYPELKDSDKAQKIGVRRCLRKPLVLRQLGWAVRQELDGKSEQVVERKPSLSP